MTRLSFYFGMNEDDFELHLDASQLKFVERKDHVDFEHWLYSRVEQKLPIAYHGALGEFRIINTALVTMIEVKKS